MKRQGGTAELIQRLFENKNLFDQIKRGGNVAEAKAMRKITTQDGGEIFVDIFETWHGFKAGDTVSGETWVGEEGIVDGMNALGSARSLWVTLIGDNCSTIVVSPKGLVLLKRPGLKFKVGDRVQARPNTRPCEHQGIVVVINPMNRHYLVEFSKFVGGGDANNDFFSDWFPEKYKIFSNSRYWCDDRMIDHIEYVPADLQRKIVATPAEEAEVAELEKIDETALTDDMPLWLREMMICINAKVSHMFTIAGNIFDQFPNRDGKFQTIYEYLAEIFRERHIMIYSLSRGLQFATRETEQWFRSKYFGSTESGQPQSVAERAKQERQHASSITGSIGSTPDAILSFLERILLDENVGAGTRKPILFIDYAHNLIPSQVTQAERVVVERLERWSRDQVMRDQGGLVVMLTPAMADLAKEIRANQSSVKIVKIPRPDYAARLKRWQAILTENGIKLSEAVSVEMLATITNGLTLRQIADMSAKAKAENKSLDPEYIKNVKKKQIEDEFEGLIEVKMPKFGLALYGGMDNVKEYLTKVAKNMIAGVAKRVPMGILAAGPPGTGKTFLFECWAYDCGIIVIKLKNLRSKWVGESESNMERVASLIDEMAPVIVIEDEADQAETSRDTPSGDAGTSNRMRQIKLEFCSDPKRRGKVIWVRLTNRDDLIDEAYKRKGRTDTNIGFVLPDEKQLISILPVSFKQNGVKTNIIDFTPFAKLIADRIYCTPADVSWMVTEADELAEIDGKTEVEATHLEQAIASWEMDSDPDKLDNQLILAINGSNKRLRAENWEMQLASAEKRISDRKKQAIDEATAEITSAFPMKLPVEEKIG
jgi:SpoVK/Ycf46/Vps4 family AAA+-type ATPase